MKSSDESVRGRRGSHADALERMREMILSGALPAGDWIDEVALARDLGVSRTPVREALKVLAAEGLVELLVHRGARVRVPTIAEIRDLFSVIAALERLAAEIVAANAGEAQLAGLREMHDAMRSHFDARDREGYFALNHAIHERLIELAANDELSRTHAGLMTRARRPRFIAITSDARWTESMKEHELILSAIETRNGQYAGELLFRHVLKTGTATIDAMRRGVRTDAQEVVPT